MPQAPSGYSVSLYASGLDNPRLIRTAPNGDLFLAESRTGLIKVFRSKLGVDKAEVTEVFASGLRRPFGIAFYPLGANPQWVYVGNTDSIVRFPYKTGDLKACGPSEMIVAKLPSGGNLPGGGHWTRDIAFSQDGKKMFVSVGSLTNIDDPDTDPKEKDRATILEFNPDGTGGRVYVSGIRNAVGLAVHPQTGRAVGIRQRARWARRRPRSRLHYARERRRFLRLAVVLHGRPLGSAPRGQASRAEGQGEDPGRARAAAQRVAGDGLLHRQSFPSEHRDSAFAALHGSWNRQLRTGYKVIRVPLKNGLPSGGYEDFLTGFVTPDGEVWGRPVGVAVGSDGALFVSDDGSNSIWRVGYKR